VRVGREAGIAKVLVGVGPTHAGMGVILDRYHVLTCAHVVNAALSRALEDERRPDRQVLVFFPLSSDLHPVPGTVKVWFPVLAVGTADLAVLELVSPAPIDAGYGIFISSKINLQNDDLVVFGGPSGQWGRSIYVTAKFSGSVTSTDVQIDGDKDATVFIRGGFSGAGVWNGNHHGIVGLVRAINRGATSVAYMTPAASLSLAWPRLPMEVHRFSKTINIAWGLAGFGLLFCSSALLFAERRPPSETQPDFTSAFFGLHVYSILALVLGWIWMLYSNDYCLHNWPFKIPGFGALMADPNSIVARFFSVICVLLFIAFPTYIQGHFVYEFHTRGNVYIYPDQFGYTAADLGANGGCLQRTTPLCKHPNAGLYSVVSPTKGSKGGYFDNAYHYGGPGSKGTVTFFPILQHMVLIIFSTLALFLNARAMVRTIGAQTSYQKGNRMATK
jgi:Trypsin-like peptidase domain